MNAKKLIFLYLITATVLNAETLFFNSPEPKDRIAGVFQKQKQESGTAEKEVTNAILQVEKTLSKNISVFASMPYTRIQESGEKTREHLNQQQLGMKFSGGFGDLQAIAGSSYYFATGKERMEIGSERFGNFEVYGGLSFRIGSWFFFTNARWNTQMTPYLKERRGEEFEKVWYFEACISYRVDSLEWLLEATRVIRYDPQKENLYSTIVSPGVLAHLQLLSVGISVPITTSRSYEPDGTLAKPNATFEKNDFDYGLIVKVFRYY
ncbi:hypothetical protein [Leptospira yasudae]|uniref:hypothetical protein n=1 Tax=Leptospira yasudae TaxID=2202201 RepID=UPI00109108C7|nr:hypothetical protein [Leptospira yasudae]TGM96922.1 hypothetical protein EHR10_14220 [Leptospira yasudae]